MVRFEVPQTGEKPLHPGDRVVLKNGTVIGTVTSCAFDTSRNQVGLACVLKRFAKEGPVAVYPAGKGQALPSETKIGKRTVVPVQAQIVSRFPMRQPAVVSYLPADGD